MFQFCRYPDDQADAERRLYQNEMSRLVAGYGAGQGIGALYLGMLELSHRIPHEVRCWLALLRLELWIAGECTEENLQGLIQSLKAHATGVALTLFEQEEAIALLEFNGEQMQLRNQPVAFAIEQAMLSANERENVQLEGVGTLMPSKLNPKRAVSYRPLRSGFFSVIENVALAEYLAETNGQSLLIDLDGHWWSYPLTFREIFGERFNYLQDARAAIEVDPVPYLDMRAMRNYLFGNLGLLLPSFTRFKIGFYARTHNQISIFCQQFGPLPEPLATCVFVRRGDKLKDEAIEIPTAAYEAQFRRSVAESGSLELRSDDAQWAADVVSRMNWPGVFNATPNAGGGSGYEILRGTDVTGTLALMQNYLALVRAKTAHGDCTCNLVNAASWSRIAMQKKSVKPTPLWPTSTHALL